MNTYPAYEKFSVKLLDMVKEIEAVYRKGGAISLCGVEVERVPGGYRWNDRYFLTTHLLAGFIILHELEIKTDKP